MANILKVTPSEVEAKATEILKLEGEMDTLLTNLDNQTVDMINNDWIGDAGNAYQNQFKVLYTQVSKSLGVIQQHANNLSKAAKRYAEVETAQANAVSGLDATDIF